MRQSLMKLGLIAIVATLGSVDETFASSHREAPFITKNPKVDNTDFYMFRSYEEGRSGFVTLIANFQPLQDAYGGPNYFSMDPEALYEIHVDNTGDAKEDITFQFRFQNPLNDATGGQTGVALAIGANNEGVSIPFVNANLYDVGAGAYNPITTANQNAVRNVKETYNIKVVRNGRRSTDVVNVTNADTNAATFIKPIDYVGEKSLGSAAEYKNYADQHIYNVNIPGCNADGARVFVGQRKENFAVLLGTIFDLVNAPAALIADGQYVNATPNPLTDKNVTSIALEIPTSCLTQGSETVIGGWSTASVRQARVINPNATYGRPSREGGAWTQVSRLGSPLVNEVVIGIADKDRFNSSEPKNDAQFAKYVLYPTLPVVLSALFGSANVAAPTTPRNDLVAAFLTGVAGVNQFTAVSNKPAPAVAEMLRLNTAIGPTPYSTQTSIEESVGTNLGAALCFPRDPTPGTLNLGAEGCDPAGFPNGRRPGDDVVDIALRVSMGYLVPAVDAPAGGVPFNDTVAQKASDFQTVFPYLNAPNPGAKNINL